LDGDFDVLVGVLESLAFYSMTLDEAAVMHHLKRLIQFDYQRL
jgi:hypothetical protein